MRNQEVSQRYAKALYSEALEKGRVETVLNEIRNINEAISKEEDVKFFFCSPVVKAEEQVKVLQALFQKKTATEEVQGVMILLVKKRRMKFLPQIVSAYQAVVDNSQGVARGQVYSATTLFAEDRLRLETTISRYTGKKAVLEYHEDKSLLGGMVAQVGSFTFDDSLETQLRIMKESLKQRRAH